MSCRYLLTERVPLDPDGSSRKTVKVHTCLLREEDEDQCKKMHDVFFGRGLVEEEITPCCPFAERKQWTKCGWRAEG
ncbi:hypothetical protein ACFL54_04870 [Planctomycetota bacterium]